MSLNIRKAIDRSGMTQRAVAAKMGVTPIALQKMLKPDADVKRSTMQKIADAIGCEIEGLFDGFQQTEAPTLADQLAPRDTNTIVCPHCGSSIHLRVDTESAQEEFPGFS